MIYLNSNNDVSNPDLGIAANYNDGTYAHTGIFRDASDGIWKIFDSYTPEPDANVYIDTTNTSFHLANFQANTIYGGNTSTNWFISNTGGTYVTGTVNAASHTVGTSTVANSTGVYTGTVNATTISTGSVNVVNASGLTTTANVSIGSAGELILTAGAGIYANGGLGSAGQVLTSNATSVYWASPAASGVTSVATGNGVTGGTITTTGTISVVAGTGTVVNATGVHVNSTYIGTLSANNTTYVNGKTEGNLNVNSATYATSAGSATNATSAGSATNATYATSAGSATNASAATNATYATSAGSATNAGNATTTSQTTFSTLYNNDWFRNNNSNNGLYNQSAAQGIWPAGNYNSYGNYTTYGTGTNSWQGWSIQGTFSFMGRSATDFGLYDAQSGHWAIYVPYNTSYMGLNSSSVSASYSVYVSGSIYATSNITAYSDRRKKKNIVTVDNALDKIMNLRGVFYEKIDNPIPHLQDKREIGVIAQEVEEVLPEVVTYAEDVDEYGVTYGNFAGLFIEAIKEQQNIIEDLKIQVNELKEKTNGNN
jgi:hypothetical protein